MDVSISEIGLFLRCRRAWDIQSPNRRGLRPAALPSPALAVGTAVHAALAAQAEGKDVWSALSGWYNAERTKFVAAYTVATGGAGPSDDELAPLDEAFTLACDLVTRYFARYGDDPLGGRYRYLGVEQTFRVPIPGTDGHFIGTFDALAVEEATGQVWIIEHKTYKQAPDPEVLTTYHHQFTAYAWAARALLGKDVAGILYDGICSKLPKPPALLKSGKLSTAYADTLDYVSYDETVRAVGHDPHDYAGILSRLRERDAQPVTPFYARHRVAVTPGQVDAFAGYLPAIYRAMTEAPAIYPTFDHTCHWSCFVRDLCHAMQHGEDVDWLIQTAYRKADGSQSFKQRGGEEVAVDAADLAA